MPGSQAEPKSLSMRRRARSRMTGACGSSECEVPARLRVWVKRRSESTAAPAGPRTCQDDAVDSARTSASNAYERAGQTRMPRASADATGERLREVGDAAATETRDEFVVVVVADSAHPVDEELHLGPLEIRLSLAGNQATVWFGTHSHAAADALAASSGHLRSLLGQAGFAQVNVDVSRQSGQQSAFAGSSYRSGRSAADMGAPAVGDDPLRTSRPAARSAFDAYA